MAKLGDVPGGPAPEVLRVAQGDLLDGVRKPIRTPLCQCQVWLGSLGEHGYVPCHHVKAEGAGLLEEKSEPLILSRYHSNVAGLCEAPNQVIVTGMEPFETAIKIRVGTQPLEEFVALPTWLTDESQTDIPATNSKFVKSVEQKFVSLSWRK